MESLIMEAKDQTLNMCYHYRNIMKKSTDSKCRKCYKAEEHIKHTVVGCTTLAPSEHTNKYNKVGGYIYWMIRQHMGLQVTDKYYEHTCTPEMDINIHSTTIMWDVPVITD
jgi:hypothetical protein